MKTVLRELRTNSLYLCGASCRSQCAPLTIQENKSARNKQRTEELTRFSCLRLAALFFLSSSVSHVPSVACQLHLFFFSVSPPTPPPRLLPVLFRQDSISRGCHLLLHTLSLLFVSPYLTFSSFLVFSLSISFFPALLSFSCFPVLSLTLSLSFSSSSAHTSSSSCHLPVLVLLSSWDGVLLSVQRG